MPLQEHDPHMSREEIGLWAKQADKKIDALTQIVMEVMEGLSFPCKLSEEGVEYMERLKKAIEM